MSAARHSASDRLAPAGAAASPRIFIDHLPAGAVLAAYAQNIERGFAHLGPGRRISASDRVVIKPNLTFPEYRKGVMTSPEALRALVEYVRQFTRHITVCESDSGGYNRFSMDQVYQVTGIAELARQLDVRLLNLSLQPANPVDVRAGLRRLTVPIPKILTEETDMFITMPVPKVHANTTISLSIKNQWGIIQDPAQRLKLHPYFSYVIDTITKLLPRPTVVMDGRYGLTRNGPMRGDVLDLNWMLLADDLLSADCFVSRLMGFEPRQIGHLRHALQSRGAIASPVVSGNPADFSSHFFLKREWTDLPGWATFHSRILAYIGYESILARPAHWLLYKFREPFY